MDDRTPEVANVNDEVVFLPVNFESFNLSSTLWDAYMRPTTNVTDT